MEKIGQFEIIKELGEGALAVVYKAKDPQLGRYVALKVLHPIFSKNKKNIERLRKEAQTLAKLNHSNVVRIYHLLEKDEILGIVNEYVDGNHLGDFLQTNKTIIPEIACKIICEILEALKHAHSRNIIHRDIKPENIIISSQGEVKLADFSIAKFLDQPDLTMTGHVVGSPFYLSPEQAKGEAVDSRSDLYSVGILFYKILTGKLPEIVHGKITPPSQFDEGIPTYLDKIILKSLNPDPFSRHQSAQDLKLDIEKNLGQDFETFNFIDIKAYFKNPQKYTSEMKKMISGELFKKGLENFKEKKFHQSSSLWNRALVYNPLNKDVQNHLDSFFYKKKHSFFYKKGVILSFAFGVILCGVYFLVKFSNNLPQGAPQTSTIQEVAPIHWAYLNVHKSNDIVFYINEKKIEVKKDTPLKLKPGVYQVRFQKKGFKDIQSKIELKPNETSNINIGSE